MGQEEVESGVQRRRAGGWPSGGGHGAGSGGQTLRLRHLRRSGAGDGFRPELQLLEEPEDEAQR